MKGGIAMSQVSNVLALIKGLEDGDLVVFGDFTVQRKRTRTTSVYVIYRDAVKVTYSNNPVTVAQHINSWFDAIKGRMRDIRLE